MYKFCYLKNRIIEKNLGYVLPETASYITTWPVILCYKLKLLETVKKTDLFNTDKVW